MSTTRPDIFSYHDYRRFLVDWLAYKKVGPSRLSLRTIAGQAGLASGYLPMVLAGKRALSHTAWIKLSGQLGLTASEKQFFEYLLILGTSDSHEARLEAFDKMKRSSRYQELNPKETEVHQYLTHWYYVAIRELAFLEDFQEDPKWIQSQLRFPVSLMEVKGALSFLLTNGYLQREKDGKIRPPEISLDCTGGVYRLALGQFHKQMLQLATSSIDAIASDERQLIGHSCALSPSDMTKAQEIVQEAIEKIQKLSRRAGEADSIYHMEIALFPLTTPKRSAK